MSGFMNYSMLGELMKLLRTICKLFKTLPMLEHPKDLPCRSRADIYRVSSMKLRLTLPVNGYYLVKTSQRRQQLFHSEKRVCEARRRIQSCNRLLGPALITELQTDKN